MIRCAHVAGLFVIFLLFIFAFAAFPWVIQDFTSQINIGKDSTLSVVEKITVDFQAESSRGIYRDIPVKYKRGAYNYNLRLKIFSVEDETGEDYQFKVTNEGRYIRIRIGNPDRYVQGINTYHIFYQVKRAINYFESHDELYWNVTGDEWDVPIIRTEAVVGFPDRITQEEFFEELSWESFSGPWGSITSRANVYEEDGNIIFNVENLRPREGLTILVSFPKGYLDVPHPLLETLWFFQDNGFFVLPIVVFIFMFLLWLATGKNPDVRRSVMVRYHPPAKLTPSEAGTIVDERVDITDITAMVIDLAVRGYFKIKQVASTKLLFLSKKDYIFNLLKEDYPNDANLKKHERSFLMGIFEGGKKEVALSSLKNKFYLHLSGIKNSVYAELTREGYFSAQPDKIRKVYFGFGLFLIFIGFFLARAFVRLDIMVSMPLSGAIIIAFSFVMPRLTLKGVNILYELLGLREFIKRVEKDRLRKLLQEEPLLFDKILPYAMAMGVADEWAEAFQDLYTTPPNWYESSLWVGGRFHTPVFVAELGESLRMMGDTLSSSPPRASASSGKSGFGGGGFSGGGFGGGGGGKW
ncbi:DUF2207 domain-containing protein [Candidatus Aerophobetes bacterium]|nr:DUF2207 domain-containing protein [Candidatus Aerophobetes bacterium]